MIAKELYERYIGLRLLHDLNGADGKLLLKKGTVLTESNLKRLNIRVEELDKAVRQPFDCDHPSKLISEAANEIQAIFDKFKKDKEAIYEVETTVLPTVEFLAQQEELSVLLEGLQHKDNYTYRHNIGVAIVAAMLAKWLDFPEHERRLITLGGLLHDIGKLQISEHLLLKPGALSEDEYNSIKNHALYGYNILKKDTMYENVVCLMALEHHEREDGSGYPDKKTAKDIHPFSKIIAIADVFHAMTSHRVYRSGQALYTVLQHLRDEGFGRMEPTYVATFIQKLMELAVGQVVELSNGMVGKIAFVSPANPLHPLVQIQDDLVDLSKTKLHITRLVAND